MSATREIRLRAPWTGAPPAHERSFWLREALARERIDDGAQALNGERRCDVVIVGGGFTGLWTAMELMDRVPGIDICLLEADVCGGGASGCNAGMLMNLWPKFLSLAAITATDEAVWLAEESARAAADVQHFIVGSGEDVGFRPVPWLWVAENMAQRGAWKETLTAIARTGRDPLRELSADEARALARSEQVHGAVLDPGCATLDPARLARALRRTVISRGGAVHERTPVTALRQNGPRVVVQSPSGRVSADRAVLAINAWAAQLDDVGRRLVMVASDNLVTEPVPDALAALGWDAESALTDSRRRLNYYRTLPDGRVLFGKGGVAVGYGSRAARTQWGPALRPADAREALARVYPKLLEAPVAITWTAPVEYSVTSLPFCDRLASVPGAVFATGYSGDGLGPSRLLARMLASATLDTVDQWSRCSLARVPNGRLPPEPLRWLGARAVLPALAATERCEDRDRRASALVRAIAGVDPTRFAG